MIRDRVFVAVVWMIFATLFLGIFLRGIQETSIMENRTKENFPVLTWTSFQEGDFQSTYEAALTDQLLLSDTFKNLYVEAKNQSMSTVLIALKGIEARGVNREKDVAGTLSVNGEPNEERSDAEAEVHAESHTTKPISDASAELSTEIPLTPEKATLDEPYLFQVDLMPKGNDVFELTASNYLIFPSRTLEDAGDMFELKAENYNALSRTYPSLDFYCYYIETDVDVDFIGGEINHALLDGFYDLLDPSISTSSLYLDRPELYLKYFFKTDHHWNYEGQLKGYEDIIRLVLGDDEALKAIDVITFDDILYGGYKARRNNDFELQDEFALLTAQLPQYSVLVNGQPGDYGDKAGYIAGEYSLETGTNHYAECYGFDYASVTFSFNQPNKKNLLMFVDSFSNPINELVAAHFNNTHIIDLRYYEETFGQPFDFGDYINDHAIDSVLFSGYYYFHANNDLLIMD